MCLKGRWKFIPPLFHTLYCFTGLFTCLFVCLFVYMFVCLHVCLPPLILLDYYLCTSTRKYSSDSKTQVLMSLGYFHLPLSESNSICLLNISTMADD